MARMQCVGKASLLRRPVSLGEAPSSAPGRNHGDGTASPYRPSSNRGIRTCVRFCLVRAEPPLPFPHSMSRKAPICAYLHTAPSCIRMPFLAADTHHQSQPGCIGPLRTYGTRLLDRRGSTKVTRQSARRHVVAGPSQTWPRPVPRPRTMTTLNWPVGACSDAHAGHLAPAACRLLGSPHGRGAQMQQRRRL